jgi:2,4-dienoyl-CoA reductase-like NADH-dependent reductase (Old Yellow Enzyme family)
VPRGSTTLTEIIEENSVPTLFEDITLNGMTLSNRFVRSATWEGLAAQDGSITEALVDSMRALAEGHVGLIISGHAFVSPEGRAGGWQLSVGSDEFLPGLEKMALAVHDAGGKIALQLAHAGIRGAAGSEGFPAVGPSPLETESGVIGREMSEAELEALVRAFAAAAARAQAAGFDAVQIHAAHGYLLSQFLSPFFNKRTDGYGGDVSGRTRLPREVIAAVRDEVGPGYPVLLKMNAADFLPGGMTVEQMLQTLPILKEAGLDSIELSGGTFLSSQEERSMRVPRDPQAPSEPYYEEAAVRFKEKTGLPLMLVGGIRTYETAERLVAQGIADYVALSRPLICEPDLVRRWESGDLGPSTCRSDNRCFVRALKGRGLVCAYSR